MQLCYVESCKCQFAHFRKMRRSSKMAMDQDISRSKCVEMPGKYPVLNTALEKFQASSKLGIWWLCTGRLDYMITTLSPHSESILTRLTGHNYWHLPLWSIRSWQRCHPWGVDVNQIMAFYVFLAILLAPGTWVFVAGESWMEKILERSWSMNIYVYMNMMFEGIRYSLTVYSL